MIEESWVATEGHATDSDEAVKMTVPGVERLWINAEQWRARENELWIAIKLNLLQDGKVSSWFP